MSYCPNCNDFLDISNSIESDTAQSTAQFFCKNCNYTQNIINKTLILSKKSKFLSQSFDTSDYGNMVFSDILPITREYTCPNKECPSHTNPIKKKAKFFRKNNSFVLKYICVSCNTKF
jgi:RNase P subunit RPR2